MLGEQQPRIHCVPPYVSSAGVEAVEMCRLIGLTLDPWQERCLTDALGERADGTWSAFQVGVCAPRQNGKNVGTAEPRELVGLFLLDEPLITHSAHEFKTAMESFRRTKAIIEGTPEFSRRVKRVIESHGDEGIELKPRPVSSVGTGRLIRPPSQRLQYRTRTKGGGRGFSGNLLVLDEAMILPEAAMGALLFTLSAQINPQVWLLGSAVDRRLHEYGLVFSRMRRAALSGADPRLMFLEFSSAHSLQRLLADPSLADEVAIAQANPAYGRRVMAEFIASERGMVDNRTWFVERLNAGAWHEDEDEGWEVIAKSTWLSLADPATGPVGPVCFSYDVRPDRSSASIAASGLRADGRMHVELIDHRPGVGWVAGRLAELERDHQNVGVAADERGPAAALLADLASAGVSPKLTGTAEYGQACGMFFDLADQDRLRHMGTPDQQPLTDAVRGAEKRPMGDAWAWARRSSTVDISPLVAATLAVFGAQTMTSSVYEERGIVSV